MREIRRQNFVYTLVEDDEGRYFFELLLPAPRAACALYEIGVRASSFQKWMIKMRPAVADRIAGRLIREAQDRQRADSLT
ncbi:hypothetical protein [Massilia sp. ZL223]|uniref:hypothetical protein n=1 Tax=Massilia sp. ZL223 TaxID=2824904 RepID=UPI001B8185D1|nr:hypothetical protein [Massilia sp. ZL223]MBQ5965333.1 hypothetical protein [Massilia sp. ZL223]